MAGRTPSAERGIRHVWLEGVIMTPGLDAYAVAVAAALYVHMNADGVCWPSVRLMVAEAHCGPNVVTGRIKLLEKLHLLRVDRKPRGKNTYRATLPSVSWGDTDRRRRGAPSVSPEAESVSPAAPSVSPEGSICVPRSDVTGNREPVNPALSGGAPDGAPALGGQITALHQRVKAIDDELDAYDNNAGVWGNEDDDFEIEAPDRALVTSAFTNRLGMGNYYRLNEHNERVRRNDLTAHQLKDLNAACDSVDCWLRGGEPPRWIRRALKAQEHFLSPAAGIERMPLQEVRP